MTDINNDGLKRLREPFPEHLISKLPKPTRAQTDAVKNDYKQGVRCDICGGWHHPKVVHLDYVGHAALTDRLLNCDPLWNWEFAAKDELGMPILDRDGGLWIRLTVCGVTRLGYGDAGSKTGGDAMKERIGDALRNAAMRFGAALDLWHKGDLHQEDEGSTAIPEDIKQKYIKYRDSGTPMEFWAFVSSKPEELKIALHQLDLKGAGGPGKDVTKNKELEGAKQFNDYAESLARCYEADDIDGANQLIEELTDLEKTILKSHIKQEVIAA